jgi:hypothetical protein
MKRTHKIVAATIATLSLAAVTAVFASPGMGMGPMGGMHGGFGPGGHMAGADPATQLDTHLGQLKDELEITAAQEPAWQAFAGKAKQQAQSMQATRARMHEASGLASDPMAPRTEFMKQRMAAMDAMNTAKKELYAVLTPQQTASADKRFGQTGPMGQMGGQRMGHGPQGH